MPKELSGAQWVSRFPGSSSTNDLQGTFRAAQASQQAAQAMVDAYGMNNLNIAPALSSNHTRGTAIDMNISWSGTLTIAGADGKNVIINTLPRTGMNVQLHAVGKGYGVTKFVGGNTDKPHWSIDGH